MPITCTQQLVKHLEKKGQLLRIQDEVDPYLEAAAIHRMINKKKGPAILFERLKDCSYPALSNIFGTKERAFYVFENNFSMLQSLFQLKAHPKSFFKNFTKNLSLPFHLVNALPRKVNKGPILFKKISISKLPHITSWPLDGGAFITLPQVFTKDPLEPKSILKSNLGMYRIQVSGNHYQTNKEVGIHYQLHRGIGIHHTHAIRKNQPLKVSIFVGGSPANTLAAILPMPEGMSELSLAGLLGGKAFRYIEKDGFTLYADADFCITGIINTDKLLPEGPFGDHLGYYSLQHLFPYLEVKAVYSRENAIWPFTVVGRPPQEDTNFGTLIHELVSPLVPKEIPGVKALHAVDHAGVHPLFLAIGTERYTPYQKLTHPQEILTQALAILGFGQCSLAKYLLISNYYDNPHLDIYNIKTFFQHVLERVSWERDLHFITQTTHDTLDYSGESLNRGSKVIIAAVGVKQRTLPSTLPEDTSLPTGFDKPICIAPGILAVSVATSHKKDIELNFCKPMTRYKQWNSFPLILLVDESSFTATSYDNFLWETFTRSNPSHDIYGIDAFTHNKHWGCSSSLVIDATLKNHHSPKLEEDPKVLHKLKRLATRNKALAPYFET